MVVRGLATAPRLQAVRQLVRGTARRRGWRSAGLYTLCPASSALWTSCCRGARTARTVSTASTPPSPSPAGHGHAELVAGIPGLHVAAGDIPRLAASAQLLALVKKVNLILARRAALRRMK